MKGKRREAKDDDGEDEEGVFVAEHGGLTEHLLVGLADGHLRCLCGGHAAGDQDLLHLIHVEAIGDAAGNGVGGEVGLMDLGAAGEIGGEERGAGAAAEVAGEVGERGDLVHLVGGYADVVERADGDEDEGRDR